MELVTTSDHGTPMTQKIEEERRALHRRFDALGTGLAAALNADRIQGGGWTHEAGQACYGSVTLHHPHGLGFDLSHQGSYRKGAAGRRLTVRGIYPADSNVRHAEAITVSMDREPTAMARDIVRRWMPGYLAVIGQALDNARQADRERAARRALNRRMEQALPGLHAAHVNEHEAPHRHTSYWSGGRYSRQGEAAHASGSVTLTNDAQHANMKLTDVPADLVLRILALLDARQALEGTISPRQVAPARRELPAPTLTIPGEVLTPTGAADRQAPMLPHAADLLF
ncbi:hypothetical protein OG756_41500 (plasmid) [Streptomyces sp. NBC_01310]|uniref:hypothetical protein n=1 Tax=Streptomyces TaxID=1883 RepID=UPI002250D4FA|nr:hypothetical protein [Streptomyces virginiae]MCX5278050.1 hypothetical protein [Streptomyces virginiae]WSJ64495.1 hypothetical protein OG756_41500 [Streptomyces sp. NBC_01310]